MHSGNSFDSSSADVDYKPKGAGGGSDTVSVEVFLVAGGTRTSLGTASAKVTVQKRDDAPSIYPRKVSVLPGGSQGFTTRLTATGMTGTIDRGEPQRRVDMTERVQQGDLPHDAHEKQRGHPLSLTSIP